MKNHKMLIIAISILAVFTAVETAVATVYYVDVDATDDDDGSSWANAFNYLQDALDDVSSGDEIWVAEGTYYPDEGDSVTDNSRYATFFLVDGVGIYGGFDGTETTRSQRDFRSNVTTLTGDIDKDGLLDRDNSFHVVLSYICDTGTVLDGFTITKGYADTFSNHYYRGGGMFSLNSDGAVTQFCIFEDNYAIGAGGGMVCEGGGDITNCEFVKNTAETWSGGLEIISNSSPTTVTNCQFFGNWTRTGGGGMLVVGSDVTVINCTFVGNVVVGGGPVPTNAHGGGLYCYEATDTILTNCLF